MAVRCGVDLVVELPALYACSSAEGFAAGSVSLLGALGAGALCFGSEEGQLEPLRQAAAILAAEPRPFRRPSGVTWTGGSASQRPGIWL